MLEKKNLTAPKSLDSFARGLLATTCLTAACGSTAIAGTINLPNSDFPNSPTGVLLPVGTTTVTGFAGELPGEGGFLNEEWFEFQGLTPGSSYSLSAQYFPLGDRETSGNGESGLRMNVFTDSLTPLFSSLSLEGSGVTVSGVVPSDGFLDIEITTEQGLGGCGRPVLSCDAVPRIGQFRPALEGIALESGGGSTYQVTLSQVPEPGTLATAGLALAGALAWARKRRQ
jgi:hypothetical protein